MANQIRVVRILVIQGEPGWVYWTLAKSYVQPDRAFRTPYGVVTETLRIHEEPKANGDFAEEVSNV